MKFLKWSALIFGGLIFLVLGTVAVVWFFPSLVINDGTVAWALKKQSAIQFKPVSPNIHISVNNKDIFKQKIVIDAEPFCFDLEASGLSLCSEHSHFEILVGFPKFKPMIYEIGPVNIVIPNFKLVSVKKEETHEESTGPSRWIPRFSDDIVLAPLLLDLKKIELISAAGSKTVLAALLTGKKEKSDSNYLLNLKASTEADKDPKKIELELKAEITENYESQVQLSARGYTPGKKPRINLDATGNWHLRKMQGKLTGSLAAKNFVDGFRLIEIKKWTVEKKERFSFSGRIESGYLLKTGSDDSTSALPAPELQLKLAVDAKIEENPEGQLEYALKVFPIHQYGLSLEGEVAGKYGLDSGDLLFDQFLVSLKSDSFQKTVQALKKSQFAIPAPFNELNGKISFLTEKPTLPSTQKEPFVFPFALNTDLRSSVQALVTQTKGEFKFDLNPFSGVLNLQSDLNDVALQAPDLDPVTPMPAVGGDSRVVEHGREQRKEALEAKKSGKDESAPSIFVDIKVRTPQKPIRIYHRLLHPFAAFRISVDVRSPRSPVVDIQFEPFKISYLKREATLERMKINLDEEKGGMAMEGRVSIKKADYMLYADILQKYGKTDIHLSSEPPLPESDIVSLILFNQTTAELDPGSSDSVNDTRTAITNRAIGFFSFWVLSSTPVESVNFDSTTGVYSARVKLPGGLSATVGSNWDKAQEVGLRKRLGKRWILSADVITNSDGETRQESMVEWYKRY